MLIKYASHEIKQKKKKRTSVGKITKQAICEGRKAIGKYMQSLFTAKHLTHFGLILGTIW